MKTRILLVDDEASARLLFEELLHDKEVEVVTAANGIPFGRFQPRHPRPALA